MPDAHRGKDFERTAVWRSDAAYIGVNVPWSPVRSFVDGMCEGLIPMSEPVSSRRVSKLVLAQRLRDSVDSAPIHDAVVKAAWVLLTPEQMSEVVADRMIIEQVKGMLMVIYDLDADRAFDVLKSRSHATDVKLGALAAQLASDFRTLSRGDRAPSQANYDDALLTAHQRIALDPAGLSDSP